jgi:hypothetical protein
MCGGVRSMPARAEEGVSPVRTAEVIADAGTRLGQVLVDVGAERLERRDVDDTRLVGESAPFEAFTQQIIERDQERREGLAGPRRRGDQCMAAGADRRPTAGLRRCRRAQCRGKPSLDCRVKSGHGSFLGWKPPVYYRVAAVSAGSL